MIKECRLCNYNCFDSILDLGSIPLANNLLINKTDAHYTYPLHMIQCNKCGLCQLNESINPSSMFEHYRYFSSHSQTFVNHAKSIVQKFVQPNQKVLEIASNDGYLLQHAKQIGANILGIDPAKNIADYANSIGIPTKCDYFNSITAEQIVAEWGKADVIFAFNVLAHVPNPNEIAAGIKKTLSTNGVAHIEIPWLGSLIQDGSFDTIYHEHYSYFSVHSLCILFLRNDLTITNIELLPIHGGSLHLQVRHSDYNKECENWLNLEHKLKINTSQFKSKFVDKVNNIKQSINNLLDQYPTMAGFGAAAKTTILLNVLKITDKQMPCIIDVSPHKQHHFIPGTLQKIMPPEYLIETQPKACLIFPWNLSEEISRRNIDYLNAGGTFFTVIPSLKAITL